MNYITAAEYMEITGQTAPSDFEVLADVADNVVDAETLYGLVGRDLTALPEYILEKVKQAAAAQIQYLDNRGGVGAINDADYASASLGKFSYSAAGNPVSDVSTSPMLGTYLPIVCAYLRGVS